MSSPRPLLYTTVADYLAKEERSSVRHEYVDGQIFAMAGATLRHNIIAGKIYSILLSHLQGSSCRAYMNDVKVRVESANTFYYPDVVVSCGAFDGDSVIVADPVLIVEVLSPSTAAIDRREKMLAYRQIESVQEYLIVHQRKKLIHLYRKDERRQWNVFDFGAGTDLTLESVPLKTLSISIESIYADADLPGRDNWEVREGADLEADDQLDW